MGRPAIPAENLKPSSVCWPYQEAIWSQYLTDHEQRLYARVCRNAGKGNKQPPDVYDYYIRRQNGKPIPADLPPQRRTWQPPTQRTSSGSQHASVDVAHAVASTPVPTTSSDFLEGLDDALPSRQAQIQSALRPPHAQRSRTPLSVFSPRQSSAHSTSNGIRKRVPKVTTQREERSTPVDAGAAPTLPPSVEGSAQNVTPFGSSYGRRTQERTTRTSSSSGPRSQSPAPSATFLLSSQPRQHHAVHYPTLPESWDHGVEEEQDWIGEEISGDEDGQSVHNLNIGLSSAPVTIQSECETATEIIILAARRLTRLPAIPSASSNYLRHQALRMQVWVAMDVPTKLLAREFFRYVGSLTDRQDPHFLHLDDNEFGLPFNALTHTTVTRLLGEKPVLVAPRAPRSATWGGRPTWQEYLRDIFNPLSEHQWQKHAGFHVELRRWVEILHEEGVSGRTIKIWLRDLGLLMRRFVWIIPSHESKTLFRLDKQQGKHKRLRTRWFLPGLRVDWRERALRIRHPNTGGPQFEAVDGSASKIRKWLAEQRQVVDPLPLAHECGELYRQLDHGDDEAIRRLEEMVRRALKHLACADVEWYHDQINDLRTLGGQWIPFWACGDEFPVDDMQALPRQIVQYQASASLTQRTAEQ